MQPTGGDVDAFIGEVTPAKRKRDAETLVALYRDVTGLDPELWGNIVGFGTYHYRYRTGREDDAPAAAFAPRKAATTVYFADGVGAHESTLAALGAHTTGVGCLYLKDLDLIDMAVLREIVAESFARVNAASFGQHSSDDEG